MKDTQAPPKPDTRLVTSIEIELLDGTVKTFAGRLLGTATSQQTGHRDHPGLEFAPKGVRCAACRWLTVDIYREYKSRDSEGFYGPAIGYVVHTTGPSDVPGEYDYERFNRVASGFEVVEALTVRKPSETFLPPQHARALAQAAGLDDGIAEAYVNRAVA